VRALVRACFFFAQQCAQQIVEASP